MTEQIPPQLLSYLRSGAPFAASAAAESKLPEALQTALREAVHVGLMNAWGRWFFADGSLRWVIAEVCDAGTFDRQGRKQPTDHLGGDIRILRNAERMRYVSSSETASAFSAQTLLLPGKNVVEVTISRRGWLRLQIHLDRPLAEHAWTSEQRSVDLVIFCAADQNGLDAFRTLYYGAWHLDQQPFKPTLGAAPFCTSEESWRSPVAKLLSRVQPPFAERLLRIPAAVIAETAGDLVFDVYVGRYAEPLLAAFEGKLRINCLPLWNVALGAVDQPRVIDTPGNFALEVDAHPLRATNLIVLDCFDRHTGNAWCDDRFAADRDPAATYRIAEPRPGVAQLHLAKPASQIDWRITYLAQTASSEVVQSGATWLSQGNEHLVARTPMIAERDANRGLTDRYPEGRVDSDSDLVELIWRVMPTPIRDQFDREQLATHGRRAIGMSSELQPCSYPHGPEANLVRTVMLPLRAASAAEELTPWFERLGYELEHYLPRGEAVVVRGAQGAVPR